MSVGEGPRPREKQTPQRAGSLLGCGRQEPLGGGGASAGTQAAHAAREPRGDGLPRVHSLTIRHVLPGRFWHLWSPPAPPQRPLHNPDLTQPGGAAWLFPCRLVPSASSAFLTGAGCWSQVRTPPAPCQPFQPLGLEGLNE